jgi:hypothetical protein
MRKLGKILGVCALLAAPSACAPMFEMGSFNLSSGMCSPVQRSAYRTTSVFGTQQKINAIQARYSASYQFTRKDPRTWKGIASGECR